jgi:hypothetical protein
MNELMQGWLSSVVLGEIRSHRNLAVVPLFLLEEKDPAYLTLSDALDAHAISVTELEAGGSVPELKVTNTSDACVILLDGEELVGAKQNRVLNTTILLEPHSQTIIPVSCTEQGRWSQVSSEFADSGVVMSPRLRGRKNASVSRSLASAGKARSDQHEVWSGVAAMAAEAGVDSDTGAMRDVFTHSERDLGSFLEALPSLPNQAGLLVFVNGDVTGMDLLSRSSAYARLHPKLVRSVAMEALLVRRKAHSDPDPGGAGTFLRAAQACAERRYESSGLGYDLRFEGQGLVGSALLVDETPVHCAFFVASQEEQVGPMASYRRRRGFRGGR